MKNTNKLLCLLLALIMVFVLASCKTDKNDGVSGDTTGDLSGDTTGDTTDDVSGEDSSVVVNKFLSFTQYTDEQKKDVMSFGEMPDFSGLFDEYEGKGTLSNLGIALNKLQIAGEDMLPQLGGINKIEIADLLVDADKNTKFDVVIGMAGGMKMTVNVYMDDEFIYVNAPMLFEKPIAIELAVLEELLSESGSEYMPLAAVEEAPAEGQVTVGVSGWLGIFGVFAQNEEAVKAAFDEFLSEENCSVIMGLLADCIPAEAISVETVKLESLKSGLINNVEADCYTLMLTEESAKEIANKFVANFKDNAQVKAAFAKLYDTLKALIDENLLPEELKDMNGEAVYAEIFKKLAESISEDNTETEETTTEETTSTDEKSDVNEKLDAIFIKRYFVGDIAVMNSITVDDEVMSVWNIYADGKMEAGFSFDGADTDCSIYYGADSAKISGAFSLTDETDTANFTFEKTATEFTLKGDATESEEKVFELDAKYTAFEGGSKLEMTIGAPLDEEMEELKDISIVVDTAYAQDGSTTTVKVFGEDMIDAELVITAGMKPTDAKVELPAKGDCLVIDTKEAFAALLNSFFGGGVEPDDSYDIYYYDEELIGTWTISIEGVDYDFTFGEEDEFSFGNANGSAYGFYMIDDMGLSAYVANDDETLFVYYENEYEIYGDTLTIYLEDGKTDVFTRKGIDA